MENKKNIYPFDDVYVHVDRKKQVITLYILDEDKKFARTIEEFKNGEKGQSVLDVRPDAIFYQKQKIVDEYQKMLDAEDKKPRLTYKQRIKGITNKRDLEINKFLLKYRYALNSPELDVVKIGGYDKEWDIDEGCYRSVYDVNYLYNNLDKSTPKQVDFVIEGKDNLLLQNLSAFKTIYDIEYIAKKGGFDNTDNLKELQRSVQWSVFDWKKENKEENVM